MKTQGRSCSVLTASLGKDDLARATEVLRHGERQSPSPSVTFCSIPTHRVEQNTPWLCSHSSYTHTHSSTMHRPVLAPILVSPLHVPMPSGKQQQQQKSSSFLSLDSPMSECESPFSIAESRRTSRTSYNDLPVDLDENTEQWASCECC